MTAPIPAMIVYWRLRYAWRALLDRLGDLLHPVVALGLAEDPEDQVDGEEESQQPGCADGQQDGAIKGRHALRSPQDR